MLDLKDLSNNVLDCSNILADLSDLSEEEYVKCNKNKNDNNNFIDNKKEFNNHVQDKINKLDERLRYVNYKFDDVRYSFNRYSISIIYCATILTLIESFTNSIDIDGIKIEIIITTIKFVPLVLSSLISLLAAIIKFKRYEEKIEAITRSTEKCIATMSKLKSIKEDIYFCSELTKLLKVRYIYEREVYREYLESNRIIEKELADTDYALYRKKVAKNDIKQAKIELHKNLKLKALNKKYNNNLKDLSNIDVVIEELDDKDCCFPK